MLVFQFVHPLFFKMIGFGASPLLFFSCLTCLDGALVMSATFNISTRIGASTVMSWRRDGIPKYAIATRPKCKKIEMKTPIPISVTTLASF